MTTDNLYEVLGVPREATAEQITKAFQDKALTMHPDRNKADLHALRNYRSLTEAYEVLSNAGRRMEYDDSMMPKFDLLPEDGKPQHVTDVAALWQLCIQEFYDECGRRFTPAVRAMRESTPITLDGTLLVVGVDPAKPQFIKDLSAVVVQDSIRDILCQLYGTVLDFRVIAGTTLTDWEVAQGQTPPQTSPVMPPPIIIDPIIDAPSPSMAQAPLPSADPQPAKKEPPPNRFAKLLAIDQIWDEILEIQVKGWMAAHSQSFPQTPAHYVLEQVAVLYEAEQAARARGMADEPLQRQIVKVLERMSSQTTIDSGVIAIEYERYRRSQQGD